MKIILCLLLFSTVSFADNSCELNDQTENISLALEEFQSGFATLETIRIRTVLEIGIEIPAISSFNVNPEIELSFSK